MAPPLTTQAAADELRVILAATRRRHWLEDKLLRRYENARTALTALRDDPYETVLQFTGAGWVTADQIGRHLGVRPADPLRLSAAIEEVMRQQETWGHCWHPPTILAREVVRLAGVGTKDAQTAIQRAADKGIVYPYDADHLYYPKLHHHESQVVEHVARLRKVCALRGGWRWAVNLADPATWHGLHEDQAEAFHLATNSPLAIITGPPGSGKTHMLRAVLDAFDGRAVLCAPTGRAAKRMSESTGRDASTIHRLLRPKMVSGKFVFTVDEIKADLLVIDEASMVSLSLASAVFSRVVSGTRVLIIGDPHQLPAVGPGNVLRDLIASGAVRTAELRSIKRQDKGALLESIHRVLGGGMPLLLPPGESDIAFVERRTEQEIAEAGRALLENPALRSRPGASDDITGIQVITPRRKKGSPISVEDFNLAIWRSRHPDDYSDYAIAHPGDKVMVTKNDYDLEVMNGDLGVVTDEDGDDLTIEIDGEEITARRSAWNIDHAWSTTIHKGQGSEWPVTILLMHTAAGQFLLSRQLFYTALSRAKSLCVIVGTRAAIQQAIGNTREEKRRTMLAERLREVASA